jgi:hypothetical protein
MRHPGRDEGLRGHRGGLVRAGLARQPATRISTAPEASTRTTSHAFQAAYAARNSGSATASQRVDIDDFICFQLAFSRGCG